MHPGHTLHFIQRIEVEEQDKGKRMEMDEGCGVGKKIPPVWGSVCKCEGEEGNEINE